MDFRSALNETINRFDLQAVEIARISGVSIHTISRFRNGHTKLNSEYLHRIIQALPATARIYLMALVTSDLGL